MPAVRFNKRGTSRVHRVREDGGGNVPADFQQSAGGAHFGGHLRFQRSSHPTNFDAAERENRRVSVTGAQHDPSCGSGK